MGWNTWDCYGTAVNEGQLRANAKFMAENLAESGWEYVVCDIQWYDPQARAAKFNEFFPMETDGFSRLIPPANRFPSAAGGKGFSGIASYIHGLGLKFGIHIMRGIPRLAVHNGTPILSRGKTARDIASYYSVCPWNTDMYGVNPDAEGAQDYYDSLFELYASWGVDYVKADDISFTELTPRDPYSGRREIEMIRRAIDKCGRSMVLSLSPGPAPAEAAEHLRKHANMWRMTGDFWDNWEQLYETFEKCGQWSPYVSEGCWPDCDMLPIGRLCVYGDAESENGRATNFTRNEQVTLMTLWCVFRSPLMLGCELVNMDDWTLSLVTNGEVLNLTKTTSGARQVLRTGDCIVWKSADSDGNSYLAVFNVSYGVIKPELSLAGFGIGGGKKARDLWEKRELGEVGDRLCLSVEPHGARLVKIY